MEKSHWLLFKNKCFVTHFSYSIFFFKDHYLCRFNRLFQNCINNNCNVNDLAYDNKPLKLCHELCRNETFLSKGTQPFRFEKNNQNLFQYVLIKYPPL